MVLVKICGLKNISASQAAAKAGASFLGLNFVPTSQRRITVKRAQKIIKSLPRSARPKIVGVFADQPLADVKRISKTLRLDLVQLHGRESPEYAEALGLPYIKAVMLPHAFDVSTCAKLLRLYKARYYLLDRKIRGQGKPLDTGKVSKLARDFPILLAGGLTALNVRQIVSKSGRIIGVDASGGVETNGRKNIVKIVQFINEARRLNVSS